MKSYSYVCFFFISYATLEFLNMEVDWWKASKFAMRTDGNTGYINLVAARHLTLMIICAFLTTIPREVFNYITQFFNATVYFGYAGT